MSVSLALEPLSQINYVSLLNRKRSSKTAKGSKKANNEIRFQHLMRKNGKIMPYLQVQEVIRTINQRTNGPVNAHLISWPSKAQNIQNLKNIW